MNDVEIFDAIMKLGDMIRRRRKRRDREQVEFRPQYNSEYAMRRTLEALILAAELCASSIARDFE